MGFFDKINEIIFGRDLVVLRLRKYLRKLYEGYPQFFCYGYDRLHRIDEGVDVLIKDKIIEEVVVPEDRINKYYRITADGIKLVESWNVEKLTYLIIVLTLIQILLITLKWTGLV